MAITFFENHTKREHTNSTIQYMPSGTLMDALQDENSNMYKLIASFSNQFKKIEEQMNATGNETYPDECYSTIARWERDLGIPDDVFDIADTIEQRKANVLIKLVSLGVQTVADFKYVATLMGFDKCEIYAGADVFVFPLTFPLEFIATAKEARNTIMVHLSADLANVVFPLPFPIEFATDPRGVLEKLFEILKPATDQVLYRYDL